MKKIHTSLEVSSDRNSNRRQIICYLLGAFVPVSVIAIVTYLNGGINAHPKFPLLLMMVVPALSAIVVQKYVARSPIRGPTGLGLRLGKGSAVVQGTATVAGLFFLCMLLSFLFSPGLLADTSSWAAAATHLPGPKLGSPIPTVLCGLMIVSVVGLLLNLPLMMGEELGWRGFLTPRLRSLYGRRGVLLAGVIWGVWHVPAILLGHNYPNHPWAGIPLFIAICVGLSIIFTRYADKAHTVLAPAVMHGMLNILSSIAFRIFVVDSNNLDLLHGPTGISMLIVLTPASVLAYRTLDARRD